MLSGYEILAQLKPINWNPRGEEQFEIAGVKFK